MAMIPGLQFRIMDLSAVRRFATRVMTDFPVTPTPLDSKAAADWSPFLIEVELMVDRTLRLRNLQTNGRDEGGKQDSLLVDKSPCNSTCRRLHDSAGQARPRCRSTRFLPNRQRRVSK